MGYYWDKVSKPKIRVREISDPKKIEKEFQIDFQAKKRFFQTESWIYKNTIYIGNNEDYLSFSSYYLSESKKNFFFFFFNTFFFLHIFFFYTFFLRRSFEFE